MLKYFFLLICLLSTACKAQETSSSLSKKIETPLLQAAGISMQFELKQEGKITLILSKQGNQIRIESPSTLMISDGKTVWNYDKRADRVTIDNIDTHSPFQNPSDLFLFSKNYSSRIVSTKGDTYVLELIPNKEIASILTAAGGIEKLDLTVRSAKTGAKILKANATSAKGETAVSGLAIKPLSAKSVSKYDFSFKPKASTKVIDLRE